MPLRFDIDVERGLITSEAYGVFTGDDAREYQEALRVDPRFRPQFCQLIDFSAATGAQLDSGSIRDVASRSIFSAGAKRAFVVKDSLQFGLSRMFQNYRDSFGGQEEIQLFSDRETALRWLLEKN